MFNVNMAHLNTANRMRAEASSNGATRRNASGFEAAE
jgi:hypothetical protein